MISTKGRYAIRLMIDLAEQTENRPIPLDDIAARQEISKKYLEIIARLLVKGKLLKGTSGKGGGYSLLRKPQEYTIWEILNLTEGSLAPVACLCNDSELCPRTAYCKTLPMWKKYNEIQHNFFNDITIQDLVNGDFFWNRSNI